MSDQPRHGEIWWCEPADVGRRPVLVLSRDDAIRGRGRAVVAQCTTHVRGLASEVPLEPGDDPVPQPCVVGLDSIESVAVGVLVHRLGRLGPERMHAVCRALGVAVDCA